MQTGVIVRRNPDAFIPDAYIKLALANNGSAYGAAIIDGEEGLKTSSGGKDELTIDFVKDTMAAFKDRPITFYFASADGAVNEGDIFPQVLLTDDKDNPLMCVFVDANLPGFEKKDSSISPATHFIDDWLRPKLGDIGELADGDVEKIMKHCSKDSFRKEILSQAVSRGAITLMSSNSSLSFALGDTCKEYPWGWVSNHYGFEMQAEKKDEPVVKKNMFAKKSTVRESAEPSAIAAQKAPISNGIAKVAEDLKNSASVQPKYSVKKSAPGSMSRKDKKGWYGTRIGYIPQGCDNNVEIEYYIDQTGKLLTWAMVKRMGLDAVGLPKLENPPRLNSDANGNDTDNHEIEGGELQNQPQPTPQPTEMLPIFTPKAREYLVKELGSDAVKKIISETGDIVATAEQAKANEEKFAGIMTQLGMKNRPIDDLLKMPHEWFCKVEKETPFGTMATIVTNLKNMLLPLMVKDQKKATEAKVETPVETVAPKKNMFAKKVA